jgi:F-type H+-transporting ATPase subunit a
MESTPLELNIILHIGPIPITEPVLVTWVIMLVLVLGAWLLTRRLELHPGRRQAAVEVVVDTIANQIREIIQRDPEPVMPVIAGLFIFLVFANLSFLVPGVRPPTSHLETAAALTLIVFVSVNVYGIRQRGFVGYLAGFAKPSIFLLPINIMSSITRIFSMMIRLFGNILSGEFVLLLAVGLAGFLVPIPLMALEIVIGLIQAYIFAILATVFIGAAIQGEGEEPQSEEKQGDD